MISYTVLPLIPAPTWLILEFVDMTGEFKNHGAVEHLEQAVRRAEQSGVKFFTDEARSWLARAREAGDGPRRGSGE